MSWIQDNKFIVVLSGVTLAGAAALAFVGIRESSRYTAASERYQEATSKAESSVNLPLYPTQANRDGKAKAVADYRESVGGLQTAFGKFRPEPFQNIAPQEFTTRLKSVNTEVRAAFEAAKTTVPEAFFSGFEGYTDTLARENATGLLDYQLGAAKEMLLALAAAKPTALVNLHRPRLSEEDGTAWVGGATEAARPLPFEITFSGPEKAAREFLSALAKSDKYYYVIRTVRIANEKKTPPLSADAKFDPVAPPPTSGAAPASGPAFALPDAPAVDAAAPAAAAPAPAAPEPAAPAEPAADSGRILSQVLGNEDVQVFVRLDVLQFLPVKELPKP
jgi:hypothetical protein